MKRVSLSSRIFDAFVIFCMLSAIVVTIYPFLHVLSVSLSDKFEIMANRVSFYPRGLDLGSWKRVLSDTRIWTGYRNTIEYVVVGTSLNVLITSMMAYALSRRNFTWRRHISLLLIFTIMFSGGMIPTYLVIDAMGLIDKFWVMILPSLVSVWFLMIMRTFFEGIPQSISESAHLDGASEMQILFLIYIPISIPIFLTIGLFYAVRHWNVYFDAMIYLNTKNRFPLQLILRDIVVGGEVQSESMDMWSSDEIIPEGVRAATVVAASLPIICVYPFIQKYFVKGMVIGAIKG